MTLNITLNCSVQVPEADTDGLDEKQLAQYARDAALSVQERAADWFRGHPVRITATANLDTLTPQS